MQDPIPSIHLSEDEDTVISQEDIHTSYEPSLGEINRYAIHLGMNPDEDGELLYIAKKGLKSPIPAPWRACQTKENQIYYFNFETEESQWEHPCDHDFRKEYRIKKEELAKKILEKENESQTSEDKLSFSIHSNNQSQKEFAIGDMTVSLGLNSQAQSNIEGSSSRSSNVLNYSHHTGSQNPQSTRVKTFNFLDEELKNLGNNDEKSQKDSICFSQEPLTSEPTRKKSENIEETQAKFEKELEAELLKYEQELSEKFNGIAAEYKGIYDIELTRFQAKYQQNQQDQRLDSIIQEIEICDLEIEAIEAMEEDKDLLDQETEKDCDVLESEFVNEKQTIEQKNIVILDQQLQNIRIQEISTLEAEKNKIHKEIVRNELERAELEVFLENQKDQSVWNQTQRSLLEDNEQFLLNEKEKLFKKADQILKLFEVSETHKRNQSDHSHVSLDYQEKIEFLQHDKFAHLEELRNFLHQYQKELALKAENRKSNFERTINESIHVMHKEVGVLQKHLLTKERAVQKLCETDKECSYAKLKANEREDVIRQVLAELQDLELKLSHLTQEVHGQQGRLDKLQDNSSSKNYLLHTVNTIQKQLAELDVEIHKHTRAIKRRSENMSTEPNDHSSFINLKKLIKGIEGSRSKIPRSANRHQKSENRINTQNSHDDSYIMQRAHTENHNYSAIDMTGPSYRQSTFETYGNIDTEQDYQKSALTEIINHHDEGGSNSNKKESKIKRKLDFEDDMRKSYVNVHEEEEEDQEAFTELRKHWERIVSKEKDNLVKYEYILSEKQAECKKLQDKLKVEQFAYKENYSQAKKNHDKATTKHLNQEREALNGRINQYNCILAYLNEEKQKLSLKKSTLEEVEETLRKNNEDHIAKENFLTKIYEIYNKINLTIDLQEYPMKEWFDTLQDETDYQPKKVSKIQRELSEARLNINKEDSTTTFSGLKSRKNQNNSSFHTAEKIPKPSKNSSFESEPRWLSHSKYRLREKQSLQRYDKLIKKYNS